MRENKCLTANVTLFMSADVCPACKSLAKEIHAKWVAVGFAILFGVATVVLTVLFCRQRKIYRDLEGDSSLSRLI